ncbi:hypothetical protein [Aromatoleum aromaticum]|uniref:hypothetical protein n=1 Tax=Aromatoleum aromaticum TaxID=551760 RepID=UPI00169156A1|nr:hypothetical protein [Aromatoleum aromaticum]NMG56850.1 hypothetical protein [Aromatoleum aromaticum]
MKFTFEILKEKYGAAMTLEQLAATLSRKPEGLRMALLKPKEKWALYLNARKVYIGRRMYFPTEAVAALLDGTVPINQGNHHEADRNSGQ